MVLALIEPYLVHAQEHPVVTAHPHSQFPFQTLLLNLQLEYVLCQVIEPVNYGLVLQSLLDELLVYLVWLVRFEVGAQVLKLLDEPVILSFLFLGYSLEFGVSILKLLYTLLQSIGSLLYDVF